MTMLCDEEIAERCAGTHPMLRPFSSTQISKLESGGRAISSGLSGYGYDICTSDEFQVFSNARGGVVDPKDFDARCLVEVTPEQGRMGRFIVVPPNSFCLARSREWIDVPRDILCTCIGKSTYARCGIVCNVTPLEPEWRGHITIEISNTGPLPARIYAGEGILQVIFWKANRVCRVSYADKRGKYQDQIGIVTARA